MDEVILIDKPQGMTSFGVVARLRRVLSNQAGKKVKVGHTGTLDPFATGLMIIVTGKKCREAETFTKLDKWYEAEIILGKNSSTGDPEGEITDVSNYEPSLEEVQRVISQFVGKIEQINGERAYKLAREGKQVEIPKRLIEIYSLELLAYEYPKLKIRTHVSSGTYIRTLAVDIGEKLGTGAYCENLRRTKIADYSIDAAKTLADFGITS